MCRLAAVDIVLPQALEKQQLQLVRAQSSLPEEGYYPADIVCAFTDHSYNCKFLLCLDK